MLSPLARPIYWFRQGIQALTAFAQPVDFELAAEHLSPELMTLFRQMQRNDQLHSLNVLRSVLAQGPTPPELATAALLHDAGKSRYHVMVWQRTLATLFWAFAPALFRRWGEPNRDGGGGIPYWRRGFVIYTQHPSWSVEMCAPLGASESALWLIAHHQEDASPHRSHPLYPLLKRLQTADDAN